MISISRRVWQPLWTGLKCLSELLDASSFWNTTGLFRLETSTSCLFPRIDLLMMVGLLGSAAVLFDFYFVKPIILLLDGMKVRHGLHAGVCARKKKTHNAATVSCLLYILPPPALCVANYP